MEWKLTPVASVTGAHAGSTMLPNTIGTFLNGESKITSPSPLLLVLKVISAIPYLNLGKLLFKMQ